MHTLRKLGSGLLALIVAIFLVSAGPASATALPPGVAGMIAAAAGDPATLKVVVAVARKANPDSKAEIDAEVATATARAEAAKIERMANLGFREGWTGKGQIGLYSHTGNTDDGGVSLGLSVDRDGQRWRQSFDFLADYQQENGKETKEKFSLAYEGDYKFSKRFYAYGVLYAEHDKFAGIDHRFSESIGLGYWLISRKTVKFAVEGGPAVRQTAYTGAPNLKSQDLRLAGEFSWTFFPGTTFTQAATTYLETRNSTITSSTGFNTVLWGGVTARAAFDVIHEEDPPPGRLKTDTTSRLTLIYNF